MNTSRLLAASFVVSLAAAGVACGGESGSESSDGAVGDGANSVDGRSNDGATNEGAIGDGSISSGDGGSGMDAAQDVAAANDGAMALDAPLAADSAATADAAAAAQAIISSYCTALQTCCKQAGIGDAGAIANCATELPTDLPELGMASEGTLTINAAALEAWVSAYQQAAKDCLAPSFTLTDNLWIGTSATGQSCASAENCATDSASDPAVCVVGANAPDGGPAQGVCHPVTHGTAGAACLSTCAAGEDCSDTFYDSEPNPTMAECFESDGLICSEMSTTCVALTPIGGECKSFGDCGDVAYCDTMSTPATCKAMVGEGLPCPNSDACLPKFVCGSAGTCTLPPFADDYRCGGGLP